MSKETVKLNTRTFTIKSDKDYTIPSKGMICSWKFIPINEDQKERLTEFCPKLILNNFTINLQRKDPLTISLHEMRDSIRDIYFPENEHENTLISLEALFCGMQIQAIEFYRSLDSEEFYNCVFTRDFKAVRLDFGEYEPDEITVEETYWDRKQNISDILEEESSVASDIFSERWKPEFWVGKYFVTGTETTDGKKALENALKRLKESGFPPSELSVTEVQLDMVKAAAGNVSNLQLY